MAVARGEKKKTGDSMAKVTAYTHTERQIRKLIIKGENRHTDSLPDSDK
jgi:hypothetical protein